VPRLAASSVRPEPLTRPPDADNGVRFPQSPLPKLPLIHIKGLLWRPGDACPRFATWARPSPYAVSAPVTCRSTRPHRLTDTMPWTSARHRVAVALLTALLRWEGTTTCTQARRLLGWLAEGE
jgi:hypothetical protein